uniref:Uncharacterized protein n=1 Tax=Oryza rufipogon TaxID=4529 RepID=A0A0E0MTP3_ORYRU
MGRRVMNTALRATVNAGRRRRALPYGPSPPSRSPSSTSSSTEDIRVKEIEQYIIWMLPTWQWGYVVITTPNGVLDHEEGPLLGYFH